MRIERDDYNIQGVHWRVCFDRTTSELSLEDAYGRTNFDTHTITLAAGMPFEEMIETLCHETCHVLVRGLEHVDLTKEDDLRIFSTMFVGTLARNEISFVQGKDGGG